MPDTCKVRMGSQNRDKAIGQIRRRSASSNFKKMWKFETSPTGQRCVRAMSLRVLIRLHKWRDRCSNRRVKRLSGKEGCQNMLVDHLIQYRISQWPKTAEKCSFCTCVTDIRTNGWTDGWTDGQTDPLIEMRS